MTDRLFDPGPGPDPEDLTLSAGQRRTRRQRGLLAQGIHPATRKPLLGGEATCLTCVHRITHHHASRCYFKCVLAGVTSGAATDIRLSWPACTYYQPRQP